MEAAADWKSYQKLWTKSKEYCTHPGGCASEEADPYWDFVPEILRPELYADEDEVYDSFESTLPPTHAPQPHTTAESDLGPLLRDAVYDEADGLGDGSFAYSPQLWHLVAVGESKIVAMETQSSLFNDICLCFQLYLLSLIYFREKEQNSNEVVYVNRLLRLLFLYNC